MIIDSHVHLGSDINLMKSNGLNPSLSSTELLTLMKSNLVKKSVVFPFPCDFSSILGKPDYYYENRYIIKQCKLHKDLVPVLAVHPLHKGSVEDFLKLLKTNKEIVGCKMHPYYKGFSHKQLLNGDFLRQLSGLQLYVIIDPFSSDGVTTSKAMDDIILLVKKFENILFQIPHIMNFNEKKLKELSCYENVYYDLSPFLRGIRCVSVEKIKNSNDPRLVLDKILDTVDVRKILFGTDYPFTYPINPTNKDPGSTYDEEVSVLNLLTTKEKKLIAEKNYNDLLRKKNEV